MDRPKRVSGLLSLPSTSIGKWSVRLLLLSLGLILLNGFVVLPMTEQRAGLELPRAIFTLAIWLCLAASGISGLLALIAKRERSWAVVVSVLVMVVVIGFELAEFIIHG